MGKKRHHDRYGHQLRKRHWRNKHHLLFPKADWNRSFFGKKLRAHDYFKRYLPEFTLHKRIHNNVAGVPLPPEHACQEAYYELMALYKSQKINVYHDTLEKRLQLLIDLWSDYPETAKALKAQQKIAIEFYKNGHM